MKENKEEYPEQIKDFFENFEKRFDSKNETKCDYHNCKERLSPRQIQVFTMPDLTIKVFCFKHLLATLFRFDRAKFNEMVDQNYDRLKRGTIKLYFEENYSNQN